MTLAFLNQNTLKAIKGYIFSEGICSNCNDQKKLLKCVNSSCKINICGDCLKVNNILQECEKCSDYYCTEHFSNGEIHDCVQMSTKDTITDLDIKEPDSFKDMNLDFYNDEEFVVICDVSDAGQGIMEPLNQKNFFNQIKKLEELNYKIIGFQGLSNCIMRKNLSKIHHLFEDSSELDSDLENLNQGEYVDGFEVYHDEINEGIVDVPKEN